MADEGFSDDEADFMNLPEEMLLPPLPINENIRLIVNIFLLIYLTIQFIWRNITCFILFHDSKWKRYKQRFLVGDDEYISSTSSEEEEDWDGESDRESFKDFLKRIDDEEDRLESVWPLQLSDGEGNDTEEDIPAPSNLRRENSEELFQRFFESTFGENQEDFPEDGDTPVDRRWGAHQMKKEFYYRRNELATAIDRMADFSRTKSPIPSLERYVW